MKQTQRPVYVPGHSLEEAQQISGLSHILKLGSNENVLGPSPKAIAAIKAAATNVHLYPSSQEQDLLAKLAARLGPDLNPAHFVLGNGSCDVLRMIVQSFIKAGDRALIAGPTFGMYEILVKHFGGKDSVVPLKNYTVDLTALLQAIDETVRLIFICNPNNPTGTFVTHEEVRHFLAQVSSEITVIFDEAYVEFADQPDFPKLTDFILAEHNVLVTRTFSKLYGLASMRIGFCFGRPDLTETVRGQQLPFHNGRLTCLSAAAALDDEVHIRQTLELVKSGREFYYNELAQFGITVLPSQSNFIFLADLPMDAAYICDEAMKRGVILRQTDPFGLPDNIRITIARQEDNEYVIKILAEILGHS